MGDKKIGPFNNLNLGQEKIKIGELFDYLNIMWKKLKN